MFSCKWPSIWVTFQRTPTCRYVPTAAITWIRAGAGYHSSACIANTRDLTWRVPSVANVGGFLRIEDVPGRSGLFFYFPKDRSRPTLLAISPRRRSVQGDHPLLFTWLNSRITRTAPALPPSSWATSVTSHRLRLPSRRPLWCSDSLKAFWYWRIDLATVHVVDPSHTSRPLEHPLFMV